MTYWENFLIWYLAGSVVFIFISIRMQMMQGIITVKDCFRLLLWSIFSWLTVVTFITAAIQDIFKGDLGRKIVWKKKDWDR